MRSAWRTPPYVNPADVTANTAAIATNTTNIATNTADIAALKASLPTGKVAQSINRANGSLVNLAAALTSGTLVTQAIYLKAGQVVSGLEWYSGGTALSSGANQWAVLLDKSTRNVLARSADDTTGAWAANTKKAFTMDTPYTAPASGWYDAGIMVKATTVPSLIGISDGYADINGLDPILCATSSTGQTTRPAVGATMGALTAVARKLYVTVV